MISDNKQSAQAQNPAQRLIAVLQNNQVQIEKLKELVKTRRLELENQKRRDDEEISRLKEAAKQFREELETKRRILERQKAIYKKDIEKGVKPRMKDKYARRNPKTQCTVICEFPNNKLLSIDYGDKPVLPIPDPKSVL